MDSDADKGAPAPLRSKRARFVATNVGIHLRGTTTRVMWTAIGALGLSVVGLFLAAFLGGPREFSALCGWGILGSPVIALLALSVGQLRYSIGNKLTVESDRIIIERPRRPRQVIERDEFVEGWFSPQMRKIFLLRRNGDMISAEVDDPKTANELLERIGVDAAKRTMRIRLGAVDFLNAMTWLVGPVLVFPLAESIGSAVGQVRLVTMPLTIIFFIIEFFLIRRLFGPAHLVIGADGIIVEQRFSSRFVSFDQIKSISTRHDHVTLHLVNGDSVRARARHLDVTDRQIIEQRVNEALDVRAERLAEPAALAALDRGRGTAAAWRETLRGLFNKNRSYRQLALTPEQVVAVLVDPAARSDRRIGAALALAQAGDSEHLPKIRIAAEASANQKVRAALEAIAQGKLDADAIEEAVAIEETTLTHEGENDRRNA